MQDGQFSGRNEMCFCWLVAACVGLQLFARAPLRQTVCGREAQAGLVCAWIARCWRPLA